MAKELFHPTYSPPGYKYADAKVAGLLKDSPTWWIRLWHPTEKRVIRESTQTNSYEAAKEYLRKRRSGFDTGKPYVPHSTKVTFSEMAAHLKAHYDAQKQHRATLDSRLAQLTPFFGARRMATLRGADLTAYRTMRQKAGAAPGTINRELQTLSRAFSLGRELELLNETTLNVRKYRLAEAAPRSGFFEPAQFESVLSHLHHLVVHEVANTKGKLRRKKIQTPAPDLQLACLIAYRLGWRMQSEILMLERRHLDIDRGTLCLDPGSTKNDDGRLVYLPADLKVALQAQLARLDAFQKHSGRVCRYLFTHTVGLHAGSRIRDFRRAWATACHAAGVAGRLRHDFRRTAVRNMVNATVPERVAMKITGHRTRSVFDRYHIVSPGDLQRAAQLMSQTAPTQQNEAMTRRGSQSQ